MDVRLTGKTVGVMSSASLLKDVKMRITLSSVHFSGNVFFFFER